MLRLSTESDDNLILLLIILLALAIPGFLQKHSTPQGHQGVKNMAKNIRNGKFMHIWKNRYVHLEESVLYVYKNDEKDAPLTNALSVTHIDWVRWTNPDNPECRSFDISCGVTYVHYFGIWHINTVTLSHFHVVVAVIFSALRYK